jgi:ribonuclease HI
LTPLALPAPAAIWQVHCDGSAVPNPGRMAVGAVITGPAGQAHTLSRALHAVGCNNEAELRALMAALAEAQALGARQVQLFTDNSILVEQLRARDDGEWPVRPIARLEALFCEALSLIQCFDEVRLTWVPRHRNAQADALARAALGLAPKPSFPHKRRR